MALMDILVPDIGDFDEVGVIELLVKAGDTVKAGDLIAEIETDKATMEVEAVDEGEIAEILGISETNVATKLSRLKQRIRNEI